MKIKNSILNKSIKTLAGTALIGITTVAAVACSITSNEKIKTKNLKSNKSKRKTTLLSKVKYLAIGDSVTAGFNFDYFLDLRGKLENGKVSGLSYPAFFAHFLQQINRDSLVSFDNLALSGTTIEDWLYLLDASNPKYASLDKSFFKFNTNLNQVTNSPFGQQISDTFGDFSATSYPKFIAKIKDANLLTLTLGANDFIQSLDFSLLSKTFGASAEEKLQLGKLFVKNVETAFVKVKDNLAQLVGKLLEINPNLHISLLGYDHLGSTTVKFLEHLLINELALEGNFSSKAVSKLNQIIQETALNYGLNYVNVFNDELWADAKNGFAKNEFDIHPSTKGYKKMAQDLLLKLALDQDNFGNKTFEDILPTWNSKYINKDLDSYSRDLNVATNEQLLTFLTNQQKHDFVAKNSQYEQENEKNLQPFAASNKEAILSFVDNGNFLLQRFVNILGQNKQINEVLKQLIVNFFKKENQGNTNFVEFLKTFVNSNFFSKALSNLANYIKKVVDNQEWSQATIAKLLSYIQENLLTEENIVEAYKEFVKSDVIQTNETEVRSILFASLFGQSAIQELLIDNLFNLEGQDKSKLAVIFNFPSLRKFVNEVFSEFILNYQKYNDAKTFGDVISTFLSRDDNQRRVINFTQNFASEALRQPIFTSFLVDVINKRLTLKLSEEDKKLAADFLFGISDTLVRSQVISRFIRSVSVALANELKNIKFDKHNVDAFAKIFSSKFEATFKTFFSEKDHIFLVIQDLLDLNLDANQVNIIENLIQKGYPLLKTVDFQSIVSDSKDFENYRPIFEAAKDFLTKEDYKNIDFLVKNLLTDFFITHRNEYQSSLDLDAFALQLTGYNTDTFKILLYRFIGQNGNNEKVLNAIAQIISKFVKKYNLSQQALETSVKLIKEILKDFAQKWQSHNGDDVKLEQIEAHLKGNILATFVEKTAKSLKNFVQNNAQELKTKLELYEQVRLEGNNEKISKAQQQWLEIKRGLTVQQFYKSYASDFLTFDNAYQLIKDFSSIFTNINSKDQKEPNNSANLSISELSSLVQEIIQSPEIGNEIVKTFNLDKLIKNPKIQQTIVEIYKKFVSSDETQILLQGFLLYIFDKTNQKKSATLLDLFANFLKDKHKLVEDSLSVFLDQLEIESNFRDLTSGLLEEFGIKLQSQSIETLVEIAKKIVSSNANIAKKQYTNLFTKTNDNHTTRVEIRDIISGASQQNNSTLDKQRPLIITKLLDILSDFLSNKLNLKTLKINQSIDILVGNIIYDIAELYYKNNLQENKIPDLIIDVINNDFVKKNIDLALTRAGLENISQDIISLLTSLFESSNSKEFINGVFKLIASQEKDANLSALKIINSIVKEEGFKQLVANFIAQITTDDKVANLLANIFNTILKIKEPKISSNEVASLVKWIKQILLKNVEKSTQNDSYNTKNSLISKILSILSKFLDSSVKQEEFDLKLLQNELLNEVFIVDLIKQLAITFDQNILQSDQDNITNLATKILGSQIIDTFINKLDLTSLTSSLKIEDAEDNVKKFIANFIKQPGHSRFIFKLLKFMSQNIDKFKNQTTFIGLIKTWIQNQNEQAKKELKQYIWEILQFAVNDEHMVKVVSLVVAKNLNVNIDQIKGSEYQKIAKFFQEVVNLGIEEPGIVSQVIDKVLEAIQNINDFSPASLTQIIQAASGVDFFANSDFIALLDSMISEEKQSQTDILLKSAQEAKMNKKQQVSAETFANFFDTILKYANQWTTQDGDTNSSPILKALNHVPSQPLTFGEIIGSGTGQVDKQLSTIGNLIAKIYKTNPSIKSDNYKNSAQGRVIYRLILTVLFYGYENKIKESGVFIRPNALYGGISPSSTFGEKLKKSIKDSVTDTHKSEFEKLIDVIFGNPVKGRGFLWTITFYGARDFLPSDMLTMVYYNADNNRSEYNNSNKLVKIRDLILELIRQGYGEYPAKKK
ncbi:SGNH/GDSL hydrolase family protein [Mesomycoplasma conjunctivae]|uniref:SGNH/GDSL hydrolase family protein n=1 Tax=Mesomycoplasma conjunctivae TaxID=45361 RepID=UPI003DA678D9